MRKAKRTILIAMLILAGFVPVCWAGSDKPLSGRELLKMMRGKDRQPAQRSGTRHTPANKSHPSASELLAKYAETQDKLQSFIIKSEDSCETRSSSFRNKEKKKTHFSSELRSDGNRVSYRNYLWGDLGPGSEFVPKDKPEYQSELWDGSNYFQYSKSPTSTARPHGIAKIDHTRKYAEQLIQRGHGDSELLAFLGDERAISILQQADTISVRDKMQQAGKAGSQCYVIDTVTDSGKYTLWIDPEHGYNIAKAEMQRKAGDIWRGKPLTGKAKSWYFVDNVYFEKIDNVWVPIQADIKGGRIYASGSFYETVVHHKRIEVILNPDHDTLGSFVPDDIKNGAEVLKLAVQGIMYIWQDGKVLDEKGRVIMAQGKVPPALEADKKESVPDSLTALKLLDKYRATQDRLKRFVAKGETTRESTLRAGGELSVMNCTGKITKSVSEIRYDGDRISLRSYSWGGIANKNVPEANAHYRSILWDGKTYIQYTTAKTEESGVAFVKKHDRSKKTAIALGYRGAPLMGICFVDDEPVDVILRQADTISVRDETEQIGGSPCYVIDAVTRHGKYTVWIDPQHGYNIARVELRKGAGDLCRQEPLKNMTTSFSLRNVRFEKVGDVWIPMEADYQNTDTRERTQTFDGMFTESKWHHKRTEIVLNPDFEAMSAFVPDDIKDGTKVYVVGDLAKCTWQNGQVVDEKGRVIMDCRPKKPRGSGE